MKTKILVMGLVCLFLFSCEAFIWHRLSYDIALSEVERPVDAKERYGKYEILETEEQDYKYVFEDKMIKILWLPSSSKIGFLLENKTDYSIRIIWDEAAYVDENGISHRVMHSGIKYAEKESPQPLSVVVRKGKLTDIIFPTDYVTYSGGWIEKPLLPNEQMGGEPQTFLKASKEFIGKTIQVLLPIQIEDTTNDYIFTFKINDVALIKK